MEAEPGLTASERFPRTALTGSPAGGERPRVSPWLRRFLDKRAAKAARRRDSRDRIRLSANARADLAGFLKTGERLACPPLAGAADVSVIVVVWNQPHFLLRSLRALLAQSGPRVQIVLVDNGSAAETQTLLSRLDGFVIRRNSFNAGFVAACNQGARAASGRALLMLNSDAFLRPGAIANALAALDGEAGVGAVGGRLILPSGRLQEAGCIVWADATTSGRGRGLLAAEHQALPRCDVDYCSGAFLLTPRHVWERFGGFDEVFTPGYYEDADYCMRLRQAGLRVIFEPSVAVDHFENGSEVRLGDALRISERNMVMFRDRYAATLRAQHPTRPAARPAETAP
jgi:GT2 family glycosyltransferase